MARKISDEQIKLSVIIDGNPAQKELLDLEKSTRSLNASQKELRAEKQRLEKAGQKESARYKEITNAMRENTAAITANKTRMEQLQKEVGLTGLTMAQLRSKATQLRATLNNMIPGSADYKRYDAELKQVNARISEVRGNAQAAKFSLGTLADGFNRYAGLAATVLATATGIAFSIQQMLDISGKLSDAQADVMKTTGMTKKEVDELTKSFGALQTRTSRLDLLSIAEQGGRIGIQKEEINDFVAVMDKASVALGDSFTGGAEEVSDKLGKIKFLFKETKEIGVENAYMAIGSAINVLGAEGSASEANIANFTTRIGAIADVMKPTVAETMALGAAFEESGIEAEVSARAYGIFLKEASTKTAQFAQVMGISKEEVEGMINSNPLEFFLKFSKQLSDGAKKGTDMAKTLDYLGLNADGVNKIVGAAGNNVDRFRELVEFSNSAFNEGTSLIDEYNIKNNNLAATLEKIKKAVMGWFVPEDFVNSLGDAANWFAKFIGAADDADGKVSAWRNTLAFTAKVIAIVTAAIITNVAWQKLVAMWTTRNTQATLLYNIASKARAFADGVAVVSTQALAMAQMLLTGNLKGAAQAFRVMTATMMTTPWGFILGAVAAIAAAYVMFSEEAKKAATSQTILNEARVEAEGTIRKEIMSLDALLKIARDETASKEAREAAMKKINEISPEYLGNIKLDEINTLKAKDAIDKYIKSLERKAILQSLERRRDKLLDEMQERKNKGLEEEIKWTDRLWAAAKNQMNQTGASQDLVLSATKNRTIALQELQKELDLTNEEMKKLMQDNPDLINSVISTTTEQIVIPDGDKDKGSGKEKKYDDSYLDQEKRLREELLKLRQQTEEERIAVLGEGYAKELELEIAKHQARLQNHQQESNNIKALQEELNTQLIEAQKNGDTKKVASIKNMQQILIDKQDEMNKQLEHQEALHHLKIGTIQEKAGKASIEREKEQYELEKLQRETAFIEELNALDLSEKEKQKRKEQFAKEELAKEEEMLREQLAKLQQMQQGVGFDGVQFNLLSDEDKAKLENDIAIVENALAKLRNAKDNPDGDKKEIDLGISGNTDILGFTQEQWDNFFLNIENGTVGIQTMGMAIQAAQNLWGQFDQYMTASENASLKGYERNQDARKRKLKQQLDNGYINQAQYAKGVEEIDRDLDKKKAEIEYKQAKRQRIMSIANVITSTAQAIMSIWAQVPKFDFGATAGILTGIVAATGALQLATIMKTPLPAKGFEKGLYPEYVQREQDGKTFKAGFGGKTKSGMVTKPTYFLAGEGYKPEMVIDSNAYRDLSPYTRNLLINELRGVKGFENGYYNSDAMRIEVPASSTSTQTNESETLSVALKVIDNNTKVMNSLLENPLVAYVSTKDTKSIKALRDALKDYETLRNKNIQ